MAPLPFVHEVEDGEDGIEIVSYLEIEDEEELKSW